MLARVRELYPTLTMKTFVEKAGRRDAYAYADAVIPGLRKAGLRER